MDNKGEVSHGLLGFYDYTVILTYGGMLFSVAGIFMIINGDYKKAFLCLMVSGVCDMFDGRVASTKKRSVEEKRFGIQIDSMCDLISSGILPGMFLYCFLERSRIAGVVAAFYMLCALIRLSYFNVLEEARQDQTSEHRTSYLGMPVTTIALLLPAAFLCQQKFCLNGQIVYPLLLLIEGSLFLLPIRIKKAQNAGKAVMIIVGVLEFVLLMMMK